jgi:deoxyribonuclease-4
MSNALESAQKLGCNALQIFSASPRMWPRAGTRIPAADAARFQSRRRELGLGPLVIHANYLINLASADSVMRVRTIQAFQNELVRATALGADFLVVHPGAACGTPVQDAIRSVADALRNAARGVRLAAKFSDMSCGGVRILLENTSGMGTCIGSNLAELRSILDLVPELPVGVCVDTAHAFEAGYDLRAAAGLEQMLNDLDATVGLARVPVVHANDSKTPLGSRLDRHEHIGKGKIGREAFARLLNHPRLAGRAFILETPIDAPGDDRRNVRTLWQLAGVTVKQAPHAENGFSMLRVASKVVAGKQAPKAQRKSSKAKKRQSAGKGAARG